MKTKSKNEKVDELRSHYELSSLLNYGVHGKYVDHYLEGTNLVLLAHDVAEEFPTESSVNEALRLVIQLRQLPSKKVAEQSH